MALVQNSNKLTVKCYYTIILFVLIGLPQPNNQGHLQNLDKITCFNVYILFVRFSENRKKIAKKCYLLNIKKQDRTY